MSWFSLSNNLNLPTWALSLSLLLILPLLSSNFSLVKWLQYRPLIGWWRWGLRIRTGCQSKRRKRHKAKCHHPSMDDRRPGWHFPSLSLVTLTHQRILVGWEWGSPNRPRISTKISLRVILNPSMKDKHQVRGETTPGHSLVHWKLPASHWSSDSSPQSPVREHIISVISAEQLPLIISWFEKLSAKYYISDMNFIFPTMMIFLKTLRLFLDIFPCHFISSDCANTRSKIKILQRLFLTITIGSN